MFVRLFLAFAALLGLAVGLGAVGPVSPVALARTEAPSSNADVEVRDGALSPKKARKLASYLRFLAPRRVAVVVMAEAPWPWGVESVAKERFRDLHLGPEDLSIAIATGGWQVAAHAGPGLRDRGLDDAAVDEVIARVFPRWAKAGDAVLGTSELANALVAYKPGGTKKPSPFAEGSPLWVACVVIAALGLIPLVMVAISYLPGSTSAGSTSGTDALAALRQRVQDQKDRERGD